MGSRLLRLLAIATLIMGLVAVEAAPAAAAVTRSVRLEPGPQAGFKFSSTGTLVARKDITIATDPTIVSSDRRRTVANRSGVYLRVTTGSLAGYEVLESPVAYVPGIVGDDYTPNATISLAVGGYLGYRFDASWGLASTRYASVGTSTTATSSRRAIIDGRPYLYMASGTWAGTWLPGTSSSGRTAQRIMCSVPAKPAPGAAAVYRRITTVESKLALTFDMGGRLTPALDIMERLIIDRVCATIHPTGDAAQTATGKAVMVMIKAHPELFEVGNHTMHHCNLRDGGSGAACPTGPATTARIQSELRAAETIIRDMTGRDPMPYWRPPYGASDARVRAAAAAIGYTKTLLWDIDTIDWKRIHDGGPTTASMAAKVVTNAKTGSIVLMHLGGYHTYDALPSMVMRLRASGLQPTSITDLLR